MKSVSWFWLPRIKIVRHHDIYLICVTIANTTIVLRRLTSLRGDDDHRYVISIQDPRKGSLTSHTTGLIILSAPRILAILYSQIFLT